MPDTPQPMPNEPWSPCNRCGGETKHRVLFSTQVDRENLVGGEDDSIRSWERFQVLKCAGCEAVRFCKVSGSDVEDEERVNLYPPIVSRQRPKWIINLPAPIRRVLGQTYQALDADSRALALMGARAVADMLLVDQVGDVGTFHAKVQALQTSGVVSKKNAEVLSALLNAGDAAAHRGFEPEPDNLNAVMDILENLLQAVYHLGELADRLQRTTPARKT